MNDVSQPAAVPYIRTMISVTAPGAIGAELAGGYYAGAILIDNRPYALIVSPKAEGHFADVEWNENSTKRVEGAESVNDGLANTRAMAEAGSAIAKTVLNLRTGGFGDWYVPSRDELELCYRAFKPTKDKNWVYRNGDNPSSLPPGYPYTESAPPQSALQLFQEGGAEAFPAMWHWTSTQYAGDDGSAWVQYFAGGGQYDALKDNECNVRAVRRIAL